MSKSIELKDLEEWVKPTKGVWCLVECTEYSPSGYHIASWDGSDWVSDVGEKISEYVTAYHEIDEW